MFLSGYMTERPHTGGKWGTVGTKIIQYDYWSQGSPKSAAVLLDTAWTSRPLSGMIRACNGKENGTCSYQQRGA